MKRLLMSVSLLAVLATPAYAIADQDNSAISQHQRAEASSVSHATGGSARATGGAGGAGGAGGSASTGPVNVSVVNTAPASGSAPQATSPSGTRQGGGHYGSGGNTTVNAPPAMGLSLAPASGVCPTRGVGAAASGTSAGGLFTFTWEAENCTAMEYAKLLDSWGHPLAALHVLNGASSAVHDALVWEAQHQPAPAPVAPVSAEPFIVGFCVANPSMCDGE